MPVSIPRVVVDYVLLGAPEARRQLQDSPILGDVWTAFAVRPDAELELLITPHRDQTAGVTAKLLDQKLATRGAGDPNIAFLQGIVAARLRFADLLQVVVPMSGWWHDQRIQRELSVYRVRGRGREKLCAVVRAVLVLAERAALGGDVEQTNESEHFGDWLSALDRYIGLAGLILWAATVKSRGATAAKLKVAIKRASADDIADLLTDLLLDELLTSTVLEDEQKPSVFQVSLNRPASAAISRSVLAVKADAARQLFNVSCKRLAWAVIDSGIDASHDAFYDADGNCRIHRTLDFSQFRRIVSLSNAKPQVRHQNITAINGIRTVKKLPPDADGLLERLAVDAAAGRRIDWDTIEHLIDVGPSEPPTSDHGTHVAGIIGASVSGKRQSLSRISTTSESVALSAVATPATALTPPERVVDEEPFGGDDTHADAADGMCPDIRLYDLRVLARDVRDTEFAVIAAMQYIRQLNDRHRHITIHGANLSLSIPHAVRNYACGRTPVCVEAENLVASGVVVVAAAGNYGYQRYITEEGAYDGYATLSITDPGNADGVITVGSTHRDSPHTYGVSFFSSRGPTGDGRPKPDLVAPGERIRATLPNQQWGDHDGTSMAAPHVSGAAAMLMGRHAELVGRPRRVKQVLCDTATDLGRERGFQGSGMLDVLRALQSV
jgi:serine protease AprX